MRCYNCQQYSTDKTMDYRCYNMPQCLMKDVERREQYNTFEFKVGKKIRFTEDRYWFKIIACDNRFLICTRKYGDKYYYTICDLQECIRGADNYYGAYEYENACPNDMIIALYRLNMVEDSMPLSKTKLPENIKKQIFEIENLFGQVPDPEIHNLQISYRNCVSLNIKEVK